MGGREDERTECKDEIVTLDQEHMAEVHWWCNSMLRT